MKASHQNESQGSLEGALTTFYHGPDPEPAFIHDLEREILALGSPPVTPNQTIMNWWAMKMVYLAV